MAQTAYAGTIFLSVDGAQQRIDGSVKIQPNLIERTGKAGASGVLGNTQTYIVPMMEVEIADSSTTSIQSLAGITDSTITAELVNGKVYVLRDAWQSGQIELDPVSGKYTVKFEGYTCQELITSA